MLNFAAELKTKTWKIDENDSKLLVVAVLRIQKVVRRLLRIRKSC